MTESNLNQEPEEEYGSESNFSKAEESHEKDDTVRRSRRDLNQNSNADLCRNVIKERTIGYVIEKVAHWRRLYNGYYDSNFNHLRMSLEKAADKVGVSKKSLDDYLA
jgi:hypothetical protein